MIMESSKATMALLEVDLTEPVMTMGFTTMVLRVKRASANDVINKGFDHSWDRSYRPSYDDKMDEEEYFNF
jgi:hypothetical protein